MDGGMALAKLLFNKIPDLASTTLWHVLGRTPTSDKWDLRTALTVEVLRGMMSVEEGKKIPTISKLQTGTTKDPGIKGKMWIATDTFSASAPEDESLRQAVFDAIDELKEHDVQYEKPVLGDLEVEWTGFRPDVKDSQPLPQISEEEKYKRLMAEPYRTSNTTVLYFHGGAYYLCDPATHRPVTSRLARECSGRVCSVRYRLAPQIAFPGQLIDALHTYLSLLHPPPGTFHEPVAASEIVFAGDSAGGNLSLALLQLLLQLHRTSDRKPMIRFHGQDVPIPPLPAGASANSGWFDISRSMPSLSTNAKYDYLPPPEHDTCGIPFPADGVWPTNPLRGDIFCNLTLLDHPLVSPMVASSWHSSPPLWLETGEEMLSDEDSVLAARAAGQGVQVVWEQYEAMPHCFSMLLPGLETSDRALISWGEFCRACVEDPESVKTSGVFVYAKDDDEVPVEVEKVDKLGWAKAKSICKEVQGRRIVAFEREGKIASPEPVL
ncbi:hypothetical protein K431DRAFT_283241 [Polychaeton citri CBS 116435]|uniref:Alpha/beta hydrolase fold-3 domain-containing protein n=1 Tax=Polychaeton citri CBS 116435 TaxID=1314669 RepID=A0A9P4URX9_9PEZI|nr:hypothetical protein K431DRAFT_283241 [Polychaeton citri CBS 116435]